MATQAQKTVFIAGAAMSGLVLAQAVRAPSTFGSGGVYKRLWAAGVVTLLLAAAADFVEEIVVPLSVLILVAFFIRYRESFTYVLGGGGGGVSYTPGQVGLGGSAGAGAASGAATRRSGTGIGLGGGLG